jgi:predicted kinase
MSGGIGRLVVLTGLPGSGKTTLAIQFAGSLPACRMCPDDWMMAAGIDLWDDASRARIESFQLDLSLELLRAGQNVVIEWGVWAREERDALRNAARKIGAQVERPTERVDPTPWTVAAHAEQEARRCRSETCRRSARALCQAPI